MAETTYYDSPMTGAELDEAFAGLAGMEQTAAQVAKNAETARQYGQIVADNAQGIEQISENLEEILSAADNARAAAQSAGQAAVSESNADTCARQADASAAEAAEAARQAQQIAQGALGWYATEEALRSVHPTGENGQWAIIGSTDTIWTWDGDTAAWVDTGDQVDLSDYYTKTQADSAFAPKSHASTLATYGTGSSAVYGHVKLSDTPGTSGVSDGTAATPKCVQDAVASLGTTKIVLLWTNSSPSSTFPAKKVSLSLSGYHAVLVLGWSYSAEAVCSSILVPVGSKGVITLVGTGTAYRNFSTSSSGVTFEAASVENTATPYKIYGIKL